MQDVDLNVFSTQIVQEIKRVLEISVKTLVLERVVLMQFVMYSITFLCVDALME